MIGRNVHLSILLQFFKQLVNLDGKITEKSLVYLV